MQRNVRLWRNVPDGTSVEFAVITPEGGARNFVASAELFEEPAGNTRRWNDAELADIKNPPTANIRQPNVYAIRFRVSFAGQSTARIVALLRKDGVIIRTTYGYQFDGDNGDVVPAMIAISTD